ncbi:hypothetical protein [Mesorhizobium argentiipisi]|uniref:DGQHR domain-containing protein n=1 Tax=Mesorhizobium argentiipisi TaxID=3015175 RepID=A0ABU8KMW7_9HYPH
MKLGYNQVGENCLTSSGAAEDPFKGSILPESHSHIGHGFSIVSFYTSPAALLDRAYVLRKEGWRDSDWLYQRLISQKKIESIRQFVKARQRVFLNNMIVTLPNETRVLDTEDAQIDPSKVSSTSPVTIYLPRKINSVGVIDGQHRIFSYHEGGKFDEDIKPLRSKLNILVTGIIYPKNFSDQDRVKFESEIFLEINSNQVSAAPELKQAILSIISPFLAESIAKRVITRLNKGGPLRDLFVKYFYDKERLKTTSIVSYGLRHLVNIDNHAGLHCQWTISSAQKLKEKQDLSVVDLYVDFCVERLNSYFGAVRQAVGGEKWVVAQKDQPGILNTTTINGLINLLRAMIEHGQKVGGSDMSPIKDFKFRDYKSSQYGAMGKDLYDLLFPSAPES